MGVQILDLDRQSYNNEIERLMTAPIRLSDDTSMAAQHLADGVKLRGDEKAKLYGPLIKLANSVDDVKDFDPTGWWASEKLDGVRAYWSGKNFISRQGNVYQAPAWFTKGLPDHALDGELWMGRQKFQETISVVKSAASGDRWKAVKFIVFDHPSHSGNFEARQVYLRNLLCDNPYMQIHTQVQICSREEYEHMLKAVVSAGGEGLILVKPGSAYEVGRTSSILKAKLFVDGEGTVIGYEPGKKQFKGLVGGLIVSWQGKEFNVGSGLTIKDRKNPPPIRSTITFQYTELTNAGKPKCASFVAIRDYE
jgi:DNA ligase-1